jgi:hypothetical protein
VRGLVPPQAATSHAEVSNALLIIGMCVPKLGPVVLTALAAGFTVISLWAISLARSHDPFSWERATEKNRNT